MSLLQEVSRDSISRIKKTMHRYARKAAEAARCAGEQGQYWQARALFFSLSPDLGDNSFIDSLRSLSLDQKLVHTCIQSHKFDDAIRQDMADAAKSGVTGTPGFILGTRP